MNITYHVTWEIEVEAPNMVEAAIQALQTQKDWQSTAKVFKVRATTTKPRSAIEIDLDKCGLSLCDECGAKDADIGCPDGAQLCQLCFDEGLH